MKRFMTYVILMVLSISGCTTKVIKNDVPPNKDLHNLSVETTGLNPIQKNHADQLISLFENDTIVLQYGYAEHLNDGRGITCGRAGFTTGTGDAYDVVKRYTERVPNNKLAKYLPELKRLNTANNSGNVSGLKGFIKDWSSLGKDITFRAVQDEIVNKLYYNPSVAYSNNLKLNTPLARAVIYDTIIQHGDGGDFDGLPAIINRTNKAVGGTPKQGIDEKKWLAKFLDIRRSDLKNPANKSTKKEWSQSVGRVDVFKYIAAKGNYDLVGPLQISTPDYSVTIF